MKEISINNFTGVTPFDVFVADYAGNNRQFLQTISGPSAIVITSTTFTTMSEIMIILKGIDGCEKFKIVPCGLL